MSENALGTHTVDEGDMLHGATQAPFSIVCVQHLGTCPNARAPTSETNMDPVFMKIYLKNRFKFN